MSDQHTAVRPFISSDRRSEILPRLAARAAATAPVTDPAAIVGPSRLTATKTPAKDITKEQHKEKEFKEQKETKEIKEKDVIKEHKESKEPKESKENKEHKESKESKEHKETENKDFKEDDKEGDKDEEKIAHAEKEPDKDIIDDGGNGGDDPARGRTRGASSSGPRPRRGSRARPSALLWGPPLV
jgi:outer membrane biosynthesis protein TonB